MDRHSIIYICVCVQVMAKVPEGRVWEYLALVICVTSMLNKLLPAASHVHWLMCNAEESVQLWLPCDHQKSWASKRVIKVFSENCVCVCECQYKPKEKLKKVLNLEIGERSAAAGLAVENRTEQWPEGAHLANTTEILFFGY